MANIRVNVKTAVNSAKIRHEERGGRDVIIVPSATLPDNVVMNNILYPADEIEKSYKSLERTFAPLGHPMVGNMYVSALEPEAINGFWVGAHNENVRRENGRVFLDKVIDVEVANRTPAGKSLLDAINKGEPIHTSTGIWMETEESGKPEYAKIARNMVFDHDAILIGEEGAATPSQGVGMMVNANGEEIKAAYKGQTLDAVNSMLDCYENDVEWSVKNLIDSVERLEKAKKTAGLVEKISSLIAGIFGSKDESQGASALNSNANEETKMAITDEQFAALEKKVNDLATNAEKIADSVAEAVKAAVEPLNKTIADLQANAKAKEDAERADLVSKVVANKALGLSEDDTKEMSVNALRKMAEKSAPGAAAPIFGANRETGDQNKLSRELPGE